MFKYKGSYVKLVSYHNFDPMIYGNIIISKLVSFPYSYQFLSKFRSCALILCAMCMGCICSMH